MAIYKSFHRWTDQDIRYVMNHLDIYGSFSVTDVANKITKQYQGTYLSVHNHAKIDIVLCKMSEEGILTKTITSTKRTDGSVTENLYSWK